MVVAIDNRIRGPLVALTATLALSVLLCMIALVRLHAAQAAYTAASTRLRADEPALAQLDALRAHVVEETRLDDRFVGIRDTNLTHADELVWIGNHLPAHVWLHSLRYEAGSYVLEGTSDHAADVGTAILDLHQAGHGPAPQLVSLHDDGSAGIARVHYALRLQAQP